MVHEVEFAKLQPHVDKIMEKLKPDIVVTDFCFHPAVLAADKFGIPVVLNVLGPLIQFVDMGTLYVPDMSQTTNCCCGIICFRESFNNCFRSFIFKKLTDKISPYYATWA